MANIKVMLDAGHGGRDPGAVGPSGLKEKDVALNIVKQLSTILRDQGLTVFLTRESDERLYDDSAKDLKARAEKANKEGVNYFISVHCNSFNAQSTGTETYCLALGGQGEKLAIDVQAELIKELNLNDRGIKTANYAVLRETNMPAILVETAFISNPTEEALLKDEGFISRAAIGIGRGVCNFLGIPFTIQEPNTPSAWAKQSWQWGIDNKITDGSRPRDYMTREEGIAMLYKYHIAQPGIRNE